MKYTQKQVEDIFSKNGCKLVGKYLGALKPVKFICSCGNFSKITLANLSQGQRCMKCAIKKRSNYKRISQNKVEQVFEDNNCKLLDIYINNRTLMSFQCKCGDISKIRFDHFKNGQRCRNCGFEKLRGKNNPNYNHSLSVEERRDSRKYLEYNNWRECVHKKYNFTCQSCRIRGGKLVAHHIESYSENKDLRLDVNNGITLCYKCHNNFHCEYRFKNNNLNQLNKFLKGGS